MYTFAKKMLLTPNVYVPYVPSFKADKLKAGSVLNRLRIETFDRSMFITAWAMVSWPSAS